MIHGIGINEKVFSTMNRFWFPLNSFLSLRFLGLFIILQFYFDFLANIYSFLTH